MAPSGRDEWRDGDDGGDLRERLVSELAAAPRPVVTIW